MSIPESVKKVIKFCEDEKIQIGLSKVLGGIIDNRSLKVIAQKDMDDGYFNLKVDNSINEAIQSGLEANVGSNPVADSNLTRAQAQKGVKATQDSVPSVLNTIINIKAQKDAEANNNFNFQKMNNTLTLTPKVPEDDFGFGLTYRGNMLKALAQKSAEDDYDLNLTIILDLLYTPREAWAASRNIFAFFDFLCDILNTMKLPDKDKAEVIFYVLEKNIVSGITKAKSNVIDVEIFREQKLKYFTKEEVDDFIINAKYRELAKKRLYELTEKEFCQLNEFQEFLDSYSDPEAEAFKNAHIEIENHYFKKQNNMTLEDAEALKEPLLFLMINDDLVDFIINSLKRKITKKAEKDARETKQTYTPKAAVNNTSATLSNKEEKRLYQQIKAYYDLETMEFTVPYITIDEVNYVVSLMLQLGLKEDVITAFLNKYYKILRNSNPVTGYLQQIDKLRYYQDSLEIAPQVDELNECFQNLFMASKYDYETWKALLADSLNELIPMLPTDGEYEIENARRLS